MHFNNPIPRTGMPKFAESSSQRSKRDSDSTGVLWKKAAKTTAQESSNTRSLQLLQRTVERLRRRINGAGVAAVTTSNNSALVQCQITGLFGSNIASANYFQVKKWNNASQSGNNFYVAKSIPSRMLASKVLYGTNYTYTYTDDNTRSSNNGNNSEQQLMIEPFAVNDTVFISPSDYTGVNAPNNGSDIKFIEVNTEREWTSPPVL
jgi:uncharacterized UPF0160 family protein